MFPRIASRDLTVLIPDVYNCGKSYASQPMIMSAAAVDYTSGRNTIGSQPISPKPVLIWNMS